MAQSTPENECFKKRLGLSLLGVVILVYLWSRNYNLIGDMYDYSIVTSVGGYLHAGMKPYRDFTTPLQSLTIYLCYLAELLFGRRYVALGYMNLILGMGFYAVLLKLLKNFLPATLGILSATAICAATYFQHGVLWYNSVAMSLLMLIVLVAATLYRRQRFDRPSTIALLGLLYLSSMCKINFHMLALGLTGIMLSALFVNQPGERKKFLWLVPSIILCGLILGPITEVLINHTTFHNFKQCVLATPAQRANHLFSVLDPRLLLGKISDFLPDNWCSGVYLIGLLIFGSAVFLLFSERFQKNAGDDSRPGDGWSRFAGAVMLMGLYCSSALISITNSEIEWLTSSFLIAGFVAVIIMFAPRLSSWQWFGFQMGLFFLAGFFFIGASASAWMHARVRPGEASWSDELVKAVYTTKKFSAIKNAVPFFPAEKISPDLAGYFGGVCFTKFEEERMVKITDLVKKYALKENLKSVYWGSGLQVMNRVYQDSPSGGFPLWYHYKVTAGDKEAPAIIAAFQKNDFKWLFGVPWIQQMPPAVGAYVSNNYVNIGDDDLMLFRRKVPLY